jgi:hypothetical protein
MPLFFGPGNNSFARCIKNCSINKIIHNQGSGDPSKYISTTGNPTITYPGNDYIVYTFTEQNGTFSSSIDLNGSLVIVGGGGGGGGGGLGGAFSGGGGGGGGEIIDMTYDISANKTYTCLVGLGGIGGNNGSNGLTGQISSFGSIFYEYAAGGKGGTGNFSTAQQPGGGGGGSSDASGGVGWYSNNGSQSAGTLYEGIIPQNGPIIINTSMYYFGGGGGGGTSGNDAYNNYPTTPANSSDKNYGVGYGGGAVACGNDVNGGINNTGGGGSGGGVYNIDAQKGGAGGSGLVIIYFQYNPPPSIITYDITCPPYKCPETINKKSLNTNADVDQTLTQSSRAVNAIRYVPGGKTQYGPTIKQNNQVTYLGRIEGQPGGIGRLSAKNRF